MIKPFFGLCLITGFIELASAQNSGLDHLTNQQWLDAWVKKNQVAGAVLTIVVHGTKEQYYSGVSDLTNQTPMNEKTGFNLGPVTEIATAALLAETINEGKIALSQSVTCDLPDLIGTEKNPSPLEKISILQLATHTSGLPNLSQNSRTEIPTALSNWTAKTISGQRIMHPSSTDYRLIAADLQSITHLSLNQLYRTHFEQPIGLMPLGFTPPQSIQIHMAQGYEKTGKPITERDNTNNWGATGLSISAGDAAQFILATMSKSHSTSINQAMKVSQIPRYQTDPNNAYGFGWHLSPDIQKTLNNNLTSSTPTFQKVMPVTSAQQDAYRNSLMEESGSTNGYSTAISIIPNKEIGVMILVNASDLNDQAIGLNRRIIKSVLAVS